MRHRSRRGYAFKLPAQMIVFGLWAVFFALFVMYITVQLLGTVSTFDAGVLSADAAVSLDSFLVGSLMALFRGGLVTFGAGGLLMTAGSFFLITATR